MNEYVNKMSKKNNINPMSTGNDEKGIPFELAKLLDIYEDFTDKMDKSDFTNSPRRYIVELNYVKNIKESAISSNIAAVAERMAQKEQDIRAKLNEFGIAIKD